MQPQVNNAISYKYERWVHICDAGHEIKKDVLRVDYGIIPFFYDLEDGRLFSYKNINPILRAHALSSMPLVAQSSFWPV